MTKISDNFKKRLKAFKNITKKVRRIFSSLQKNKAEDIKKDFTEGILNDSLGLARLKPKTIKRKINKGYNNPEKPLVGKGSSSSSSYANILGITKIKNGVKIGPKKGMHHSGKISLKKLFLAHENAQRTNTPKRPALQIVLRKYKGKAKKPVIKIDPNTFEVEVKNK